MQSESAVVSMTLRPRSIACAVRELRDELGGRVGVRVGAVHAARTVLRHQDRLRPDLERAERRGRVGREVRVAGAGREDHDPPLLEVPDRPAADVRLGDVGDVERRLHARRRAGALERVLESQRVHHGGQHSHVVGGRAVHAFRRRPRGRGRGSPRRRRRRARSRRRTSAISRASSSIVAESSPYSRGPISASPESFSSTRRNGSPAAPAAAGDSCGRTAISRRARSARTRRPARPRPRAPGRRSSPCRGSTAARPAPARRRSAC